MIQFITYFLLLHVFLLPLSVLEPLDIWMFLIATQNRFEMFYVRQSEKAASRYYNEILVHCSAVKIITPSFVVAFSSLFHCFLSTPFKNRCHPWKAYRKEQMILRQKCHTNICLRVCLRRDFMVMVDDHQMNYDVFPNVIQDTWQNHILRVSCRGWMKVVCMNNKWLFKNCFEGNYEYQKTWMKNGSIVPHQPGLKLKFVKPILDFGWQCGNY